MVTPPSVQWLLWATLASGEEALLYEEVSLKVPKSLQRHTYETATGSWKASSDPRPFQELLVSSASIWCCTSVG